MNHAGYGRTLTAMYDSRAEADRAADALRAMGITDVTVHGQEGAGYDASRRQHPEDRGFFEALGDFFFPEDDRATYAEGLHRGAHLLTARNVAEGHVDAAQAILDREGSVDLDARESEWRSEGWDASTWHGGAHGVRGTTEDVRMTQGRHDHEMDHTAGDRPLMGAAHDHDHAHGDKIDIVEEQVVIGKREVDRGTVRVRSYVRETPVSEEVHLREQNVHVERRAVDRPATDAAFQDRTIEARSYGEEAVVEKTARVVEEVALNKTQDTRVERVEDTVRRTEVEIEGEDGTVRRTEDRTL